MNSFVPEEAATGGGSAASPQTTTSSSTPHHHHPSSYQIEHLLQGLEQDVAALETRTRRRHAAEAEAVPVAVARRSTTIAPRWVDDDGDDFYPPGFSFSSHGGSSVPSLDRAVSMADAAPFRLLQSGSDTTATATAAAAAAASGYELLSCAALDGDASLIRLGARDDRDTGRGRGMGRGRGEGRQKADEDEDADDDEDEDVYDPNSPLLKTYRETGSGLLYDVDRSWSRAAEHEHEHDDMDRVWEEDAFEEVDGAFEEEVDVAVDVAVDDGGEQQRRDDGAVGKNSVGFWAQIVDVRSGSGDLRGWASGSTQSAEGACRQPQRQGELLSRLEVERDCGFEMVRGGSGTTEQSMVRDPAFGDDDFELMGERNLNPVVVDGEWEDSAGDVSDLFEEDNMHDENEASDDNRLTSSKLVGTRDVFHPGILTRALHHGGCGRSGS
ncbi:hypothetical protein LZ554_001127 [Drepanopeziza brunnea f. sp. 'monogermtubi']|nr:hypothetical protein LZ554_001127 [Drepanopeziza brunnea f. sp. 'monogermtubi']